MSLQDLLTTAQAAERVGVEEQTFRKWRSIGKAPEGRQVGTVWIYCAADIDAWLRQPKVKVRRRTNGSTA